MAKYTYNLNEIEDYTHGMMDDEIISRAIIRSLLAIAERVERLVEVTDAEYQRQLGDPGDRMVL
jgi:uncharacterized protein with HEPN domain